MGAVIGFVEVLLGDDFMTVSSAELKDLWLDSLLSEKQTDLLR